MNGPCGPCGEPASGATSDTQELPGAIKPARRWDRRTAITFGVSVAAGAGLALLGSWLVFRHYGGLPRLAVAVTAAVPESLAGMAFSDWD
jgi:hypothetical protein